MSMTTEPFTFKKNKTAAAGILLVMGVITAAGACSSTSSPAKPVPTVTQTQTQTAPAPTVTHTQTVSPPPPAAGAKIATFTGSGNEVTGMFNVPASGNYIVQWSYSGNTSDNSPDDFFITTTGSNGDSSGLPTDLAASGHGSTEVTGDSGIQSFNVQSDPTCAWTITVVTAP